MELYEWNATDNSNAAIGAINLTEGNTGVDKFNDIARAIMGASKRQVGLVGVVSGSVASASVTDLANATGWYVPITGTTNILSFGASVTAGRLFMLVFSGVLTITYNATSMILPTAASLTTAAGDVAWMLSLGSGDWRCVSFQKATGQPVSQAITTVDNTIARYNGTTGTLQSSLPTIDDAGGIAFGSNVVTNVNDFTKHIALFGTTFGITVTSGNLNICSTGNTRFANATTVHTTCTNAGVWTAANFGITSDQRIKQDFEQIDDPIERHKELHGLSYFNKRTKRRDVGLVYQDVVRVLPEATDVAEDGMGSVNYSGVIALQAETINALIAKVEALEARL